MRYIILLTLICSIVTSASCNEGTSSDIIEFLNEYLRMENYEAKNYLKSIDEDILQNIVANAEIGSAEAQFLYSIYLEIIDSPEKELTLHYLKLSSDKDFAPSMTQMAKKYLSGDGVAKDIDRFFQLTREASEKDFPLAISNLGYAYMNGLGVAKNSDLAIQLFHRAASLGNSQAMFNIGTAYYQGLGIEQDYAKSAEWFQKAAKKKHPDAMLTLGQLYRFGVGVKQDHEKATMYFLEAANRDSDKARLFLGIMLMDRVQYIHDIEEPISCFRKLSESGNDEVKMIIPSIRNKNISIEEFEQEYMNFCIKNLENENYHYCYYLGNKYKKGIFVDISYPKAFYYFTKGRLADSRCLEEIKSIESWPNFQNQPQYYITCRRCNGEGNTTLTFTKQCDWCFGTGLDPHDSNKACPKCGNGFLFDIGPGTVDYEETVTCEHCKGSGRIINAFYVIEKADRFMILR